VGLSLIHDLGDTVLLEGINPLHPLVAQRINPERHGVQTTCGDTIQNGGHSAWVIHQGGALTLR